MANKWAIANGNWNDGSTWNDGVVPTADDDVYLNGFTVDIQYYDCIANSITNAGNNDLGITVGGRIRPQNNTFHYIQATIIAYQTILSSGATGAVGLRFDIQGDCYNYGNQTFADVPNININTLIIRGDLYQYGVGWIGGTSAQYGITIIVNGDCRFINGIFGRGTLTINGNLYTQKELAAGNSGSTFNVVGNIYAEGYTPTFTGTNNLSVVGNVYIKNGALFNRLGNVDIIGNILCEKNSNAIFCLNYFITNFKINGKIQYSGGHLSVYSLNMTVINQDTFEWYTIDDNPKIPAVFSNLNHIRSFYPDESDVKIGIEYGVGNEMVGEFNPILPPESTVLKDVHYGNNQVGTLEVIALSGATATADNISVVNLTEQEVERVKNCATVSTVQKCFEDFKE